MRPQVTHNALPEIMGFEEKGLNSASFTLYLTVFSFAVPRTLELKASHFTNENYTVKGYTCAREREITKWSLHIL